MKLRAPRATFNVLIAIAFGLTLTSALAIGVTIGALRSDAADEAAGEVVAVAGLLAEQTTRSIQAIDIVIQEIQERIADFDMTVSDAALKTRTMHLLLKDRLARLPQVDGLSLIDANGNLLSASRVWPTPQVNFSDRDYLKFFKHGGTSLFVSAPLINRLTGEPQVLIARRMDASLESFTGVILVGVNIKYLRDLYRSIAESRELTIALARNDGTVLVQYVPPRGRAETITGRAIWHETVAAGGGRYSSGADYSNARMTAVHPIQDYPLVVNVTRLEASALRKWRQRALIIAIATLLAVLCSIVLLRALSRQYNNLAASKSSLAERETRLAQSTAELETAYRHLDAAVNNMSQGLCMFDAHERLVVCNDRYLEIYGLTRARLTPNMTIRELAELRNAGAALSGGDDWDVPEVLAQFSRHEPNARTVHLRDGRIIAIHNKPIPGGGWIGAHEDVTERRRAEDQISYMARHDPLTDLANRALFREQLDRALARMRRRNEPFTLFVFDLDLFKTVNDTLGHPVGDALLKEVAKRLRQSVRETDTVGRIGGDEFAILIGPEANQREASIILANRILKAICAPYEIDNHQIVIGISIGIAIAPEHGADADQLFKNADLALYRVKAEGRNGYRLFEDEMDAKARMRRTLEIDLRNAISRDSFLTDNDFILHYQPVMTAADLTLCGMEALVRWNHPQHGLLGPDQFVSVAEDNGLIVRLGEWILHRACRDAAAWPANVVIAVNLSPAQFRSATLVDTVLAAVTQSGLAPERLELEITESVLLQNNAANIAVLHQLKSLGVSIVLDDFGTGYSSLSYLRLFPFDKIKIDRSFVSEISSRADCAAIVCAITGLGRSLNMNTTAEGVETEEQLELLRAAGCTQMQGYLFGEATPVAKLDPFLKQASRNGAAA